MESSAKFNVRIFKSPNYNELCVKRQNNDDVDSMDGENDEDLTYLTCVSHKNGDGVHILCRSYSRKEQLWLSPLFGCLQGTKTLNNLKNTLFIYYKKRILT